MKAVLLACIALFFFSAVIIGDDAPAPAADIIQQASDECASYEGGEFHATEQAITLHDFTGDGRPEEVVDASQFSCSTSASMWGGTGGTYLWVVVEG